MYNYSMCSDFKNIIFILFQMISTQQSSYIQKVKSIKKSSQAGDIMNLINYNERTKVKTEIKIKRAENIPGNFLQREKKP